MVPTPTRGIVRHLSLASAAFALISCGETTVSVPLAAARVEAVGSSTLSGTAGQLLTDPIDVRVLASDNEPLAGITVSFAVTSGAGSVSPASATTDANGVARTRWTLGRTAGANVLTASAGQGVSATFSATGRAGRAATASVSQGDQQLAAAGAQVALAPSVRVLDANGNAVEGVGVTFTVLSGGGNVTSPVRTTNASGIAAVGAWTLGPSAGQQTLAARIEESGVPNNPLVFTATATAGSAAQMVALSPTTQTATVATAVSAPPSVRVTDANNNPVPNTQVQFSVTLGNGQLTNSALLTNLQGVATLGSWIVGPTAGTNQVTAVAGGASPIVFSATAVAGAATQMQVNAGNNQTTQAGRIVPIPPSVLVRDALGNPVDGLTVTFSVASGGGSLVGARQVTDASGVAELGAWFLGAAPGPNSLSVSAPGISPISIVATGTAGTPVSMVANSPIAQSAVAGAQVANPPSVIVRDLSGNAVAGVQVTFTVASGGGSIVGSPATTNTSGVATLTSWTLGTAVGANSVVASATGLPSVTFSATATAGTPTNVVAVSGDNQTAVTGSAVTSRPTVRVTDANGNIVQGATVTFAVTGGGGTITGATQATDAAGQATVGSWVLGSAAPNTLTATVTGTGITGNPVTFTAQAATNIAVTSIPSGNQTLGVNFTITVQLVNAAAANVSLSGVTLSIAIATGGGTLNGTASVTTNAQGTATFTINVTGAAGARTFAITGAGLTGATTAAITIN